MAVEGLALVLLGVVYGAAGLLGNPFDRTATLLEAALAVLAGVLLLLVALVNQPIDALWLIIFIAIYQQIENYVLAPAVQSRTMDVHPAVAFISVLIGGTLLGAPGALLALPATAIIQALLSTYVRRHELISELDDIDLPAGAQIDQHDDRALEEAHETT